MSTSETSLFKRSFKLAWPISLQSILATMLGMSDIMMVGHLGDDAIASVGLGNRVQFVVLIIMAGLASGVGVLSAQYYGAGKSKRIGQVIVKTLLMGIAVLLPISLLTFAFGDLVVGLATTDAAVITSGTGYLWVTMPSLVFVVTIMIFENALRGFGQVKFAMALSAGAIFFNIILNYWLINGGLGVPAMGVLGAAWATFIARAAQAILIVAILAKIGHLAFPKQVFTPEFFDKSAWSKLIKLVWPMMLGFGVWSLGTFVYQLIYGRMGTLELAVMSLLAPMEGLLISFFFGFASACAIMVGQYLGRSDFDTAWKVGRAFSFSAPVVTFVLALLMIAGESLIFMPYDNLSAETLSTAHTIFILISLGTCLKVLNMTLSMGVLRAGGDNKFCMITDITGMWILGIPLTFIAAFYFELPIFFVVLVAYSEEVTKALMFGYRTKAKKWLRNLTLDTPCEQNNLAH